jgi:hypothetical protein
MDAIMVIDLVAHKLVRKLRVTRRAGRRWCLKRLELGEDVRASRWLWRHILLIIAHTHTEPRRMSSVQKTFLDEGEGGTG